MKRLLNPSHKKVIHIEIVTSDDQHSTSVLFCVHSAVSMGQLQRTNHSFLKLKFRIPFAWGLMFLFSEFVLVHHLLSK